MNIASVVRLLVALAISLEVRPEDLATVFAHEDEIQEYFDLLVSLQRTS